MDEDYKQIEKLENDPDKKYVKFELRANHYGTVNGLEYNGNKIELTPI